MNSMDQANKKSEYAKAGVDYTLMEPFKKAMIEAGRKTTKFPNRRGVYISEEVLHSHGAVYEYRGKESHVWCKTQEGLGNKNWIAEWMYANAPADADGNRRTYYDSVAVDNALMMVNDVIAQGAMPVVFTDCIEVGNSAWFEDKKRSEDFAAGCLKICEEVGMALPAGESATLKYLVKSEPPVAEAPILSGSVTGIIAPATRLVTGCGLAAGDHIIGAASSGLHANGVSLVIKKAMELPEKFLTKLPNGRTLGEEALIPTRSYVSLVEALLEEGVDIHALLPGTGDGVGKLAFDSRPFRYRVHSWGEVPPLFRYFREELGLPLQDCLKTFNWGMGYYIFVSAAEADKVLKTGIAAGYEMMDVGIVEEAPASERGVIFEPENITLPPPGE
jgi:phosphoribosylformylglycinamidine cyclo-ligase